MTARDVIRPGDLAVGTFGADLRLSAHTAGLARLLGVPAGEVAPGRTLADLLAGATAGDCSAPHTVQCRTGDGRRLDLAVQALSDGGWALAVADVTAADDAAEALRDARTRAEAAARARSRFLASMNHELRTPLNAVIGFAETLAHDAARKDVTPDPAETREFALHIHDAGRHLLALIDDMLDLVRIDSGAYELAADTLDVPRVLQACVRSADAVARQGGIAVSAAAAPGLPWLRGDERRLRRLLGHLIGNALKFTGAGGRVDITAGRSDDGDMVIAVRDTGAGMAPEDLQCALQSFQQIDAGQTLDARRAGGAGLGLCLCRAIAEAHGGTLTLESQPGHGTTATLRLPRARLLDAAPSRHPTSSHPITQESP